MGRPTVSVCLITYNHEHFLAQAIEGALMQQAQFPLEIVIGEDCSTDSTRQIARRYAQAHPGKIRLLEWERNLGGSGNFARAYEACTGKYLSILEGDDYWLSPHKLRRQVEFLESHSGCSACFHAVEVVNDTPGFISHVSRPSAVRETYQLTDLLRRCQFQTSSAMFRRDLIPRMPPWYASLRITDRPLFAMLAQLGSLGFIDEVLGAYRIHGAGSWQGREARLRLADSLATNEVMLRFVRSPESSILRQDTARLCHELAWRNENAGELPAARDHALRLLSLGGLNTAKFRKTLARILMAYYCPPLYRAARALRGGSRPVDP